MTATRIDCDSSALRPWYAHSIEWVGVDRLLFSSDYPHWDFDDPRFAFRTPVSDAERQKIFNGNARALYRL